MRVGNHLRRRLLIECGASLLEACIAFPLIFFLVFGLIELARVLVIGKMLDHAADRALTTASFIPDLERPEEDPLFIAARSKVARRAREPLTLLGGELVALDDKDIVILPGPSPKAPGNRNSSLRADPILVRNKATVQLAFPFLSRSVSLEGRALGYREIDSAASLPIPLDCMGRPFVPGAPTPNVPCACEPPRILKGDVCVCPAKCTCSGYSCCLDNSCSGTLTDPHTCECYCPKPKIFTAEGCSCLPLSCSGGQLLNQSTCKCECPKQKQWNGSACECPNSCQGNQIQNPETCECACKRADEEYCRNVMKGEWDPINCRCSCRPNQWQKGEECVCITQPQCSPPKIPNLHKCECDCPSALYEECERRKGELSPIDCSCNCPPPKQWKNNSCECVDECAPQRIPDPITCECRCPDPNQKWNGSECECSITCPPNYIRVKSEKECQCRCMPPFVEIEDPPGSKLFRCARPGE